MVQQLLRSPLMRSISAVGAIAGIVVGVAYLQPGDPAASKPQPPGPELTVSPLVRGKDLGWRAAVASQSAKTSADWQRVAALWGQAIAALEQVPAGAADYPQAQTKAQEYRQNQAIAQQRQAIAPARPSPPAPTGLASALAAAEPAFSLVPGPAPNTWVGQSEDGLARVEVAGNRASLTLPRSPQGDLTMAQVVYAQHFLAIAAPDIDPQPWLIAELRNAQSNAQSIAQPALSAAAPVAIGAEPEALTLTVNP
jgi:hypothetical protein